MLLKREEVEWCDERKVYVKVHHQEEEWEWRQITSWEEDERKESVLFFRLIWSVMYPNLYLMNIIDNEWVACVQEGFFLYYWMILGVMEQGLHDFGDLFFIFREWIKLRQWLLCRFCLKLCKSSSYELYEKKLQLILHFLRAWIFSTWPKTTKKPHHFTMNTKT